MEELEELVTKLVKKTIDDLHSRGLLLCKEPEEEKAASMFGGKLDLSIEDLRRHAACRWSRKKILDLLDKREIEDLGISPKRYHISSLSVYRFLTRSAGENGASMNKPRKKRNTKAI